MFHFRVDKRLGLAIVEFHEKAEEGGWDTIEGQEGRDAFSNLRVEKQTWGKQFVATLTAVRVSEGEAVELVEDWSLLDVMGVALLDVLHRKEAWGVKHWLGAKRGLVRKGWRKGRKGGKRMALVAVPAARQ